MHKLTLMHTCTCTLTCTRMSGVGQGASAHTEVQDTGLSRGAECQSRGSTCWPGLDGAGTHPETRVRWDLIMKMFPDNMTAPHPSTYVL